MSRTTTEGASTSKARTRLLNTAARIFYTEGIHSVGIDRIIAEAQVTRATLYRHFAGKEQLVLAYLEQADQAIRGQVAAAVADNPAPADQVRAIATAIADTIKSSGFRGCAFLNAAAEYHDPAHPVHQAVLAHRQWFLDTVTHLLAQAGCTPADAAARHFAMLRDGAMAAGCLFDPGLITQTFLDGVEDMLKLRGASSAQA
ncbi:MULTISPECIES: TetR/AcrR family transcriptional regulator [Streptomyces]|jgi:AcrR family transcriptional regulator|uniref:TetR/AcrR family transcriptional regulator n=1 Tax=Streptomyces thermoviolaceus subsp. thermoviolaceus TaxID=66860 RepID=A0ABX0YW22_STRTL|nr:MULTISPECIES: TetR/AcrR family transcriptional regulator [Streptomyces]MCM3265010.1 TetR/AcrR family transcriptional regulator [Streptomyces thermoviolaceus]NJP15278.1 TetR/AcrR family transcriptional regulator [Streptomyces thermoviolaceus subsp. thermoviolaceus]RSS03926.1 TetR/AcrR family transcriptional regulator [Streptomyces sp. WAC00469]WTD50721.1 TetR/AcrR family transcriptional regulator [Streptomyces thermoviolaceus]GGV76531.1 TetR family transcriptional regulator [Streptomyces the